MYETISTMLSANTLSRIDESYFSGTDTEDGQQYTDIADEMRREGYQVCFIWLYDKRFTSVSDEILKKRIEAFIGTLKCVDEMSDVEIEEFKQTTNFKIKINFKKSYEVFGTMYCIYLFNKVLKRNRHCFSFIVKNEVTGEQRVVEFYSEVIDKRNENKGNPDILLHEGEITRLCRLIEVMCMMFPEKTPQECSDEI